MMKKVKLLFMLFFCATSVWAQLQVPVEEDKAKEKEIIELKKTGDVFYSDIRLDANADSEALSEAEKKSLDKLRVHVVEIFGKRLGMQKKDVQEIWDVIENRCKHVVVRNGDMARIFSYVMKVQLDPNYVPKGPRKKASAQPQPEVSQPETPVKNDAITIVEPEQTTVVAEVDTVVVPQPEINVLPKDTVVVEKKEEPKKPEGTPLVKILPAEKVQPAPEVVVPDLCLKVIDASTWKDVQLYLKKEQARGILMFGGKAKMQYHDKCYIAVFEKSSQNLVALFDKGGSERMNFISKQKEDCEKYLKPKSGYSALYIQVY